LAPLGHDDCLERERKPVAGWTSRAVLRRKATLAIAGDSNRVRGSRGKALIDLYVSTG